MSGADRPGEARGSGAGDARTTRTASPYRPAPSEIRAMLEGVRAIAVVGLSSKPWRDSHRVAAYLRGAGYRVIPVNPLETEVLGERAFASLLEVPEPVDLVDVFRRPEHTPEVARQAVAIGAKVLWLQSGIVSEEARRIAEGGGLEVVMGVCLMTMHRKLVEVA